MAIITHFSSGERFMAQMVDPDTAEGLGIILSQNSSILRIQRLRVPGYTSKNAISITAGDVVGYSDITSSGTTCVRVSDFQAMKRYRGQKHMDTGYLVLNGIDISHLPVMKPQ